MVDLYVAAGQVGPVEGVEVEPADDARIAVDLQSLLAVLRASFEGRMFADPSLPLDVGNESIVAVGGGLRGENIFCESG